MSASSNTYLHNLLKTDLTEFAETSNLSEYVQTDRYPLETRRYTRLTRKDQQLTYMRLQLCRTSQGRTR